MPLSAPSGKPCLGVVLAGGRSRRMGRDKALLEWRGLSLIDHALRRFTTAGVPDTVVSGVRPAHGGIPDQHQGEGPLAGLLAVAEAYPERRLLVVPVDMPRLPAAWLIELARTSPTAQALHFEGYPLPLRVDATIVLRRQLATWLDDPFGPRALKHLLRTMGAEAIARPPALGGELDNANTPDDWARINA
jgi:molybdopterin-guanine dinucleotide biosynthesis protein A